MTAITDEVEVAEAPTALYRCYDLAGVLLYVGISDNLKARFAQHAADKPWWPEVTRKTVAWHPSRAEAEAAETAAIRAEHPRHNIKGVVPPPPRPARSAARPVSYASAERLSFTYDELMTVIRAHIRAYAEIGHLKILWPEIARP